jgi:hypothetical protein
LFKISKGKNKLNSEKKKELKNNLKNIMDRESQINQNKN